LHTPSFSFSALTHPASRISPQPRVSLPESRVTPPHSLDSPRREDVSTNPTGMITLSITRYFWSFFFYPVPSAPSTPFLRLSPFIPEFFRTWVRDYRVPWEFSPRWEPPLFLARFHVSGFPPPPHNGGHQGCSVMVSLRTFNQVSPLWLLLPFWRAGGTCFFFFIPPSVTPPFADFGGSFPSTSLSLLMKRVGFLYWSDIQVKSYLKTHNLPSPNN